VASPPAWQQALVANLGAYGTLLLFVLLPWVLMAWPVYALASASPGLSRQAFFRPGLPVRCVLVLALFTNAVTALDTTGPAALIQILAWVWIPLGWYGLKGWLAPRENPPTLLVLRVFQRDAQVEQLFDRVIERWRLTGNTVLIAGTDVVSRTLDPDELFAYLNGRLAERFVANETEVPRRVADLDMAPDPDGRYRVNECYCFDTTWRPVLAALLAKGRRGAHDLRGFKAKNEGCIHELGALAQARHLQRVVLLHDPHTERPVPTSPWRAPPAGASNGWMPGR